MRIYLGLSESSLPHQTRIFADMDGKLLDLNIAYAQCLTQSGDAVSAYERAAFYFPETIAGFLERGGQSRQALEEVVSFVRQAGLSDLRGPAGERAVFDPAEIRLLPPIQNPEKSFVIGFSDKARVEAMPKAEIPTGYYKLPQTFISNGSPIIWPKFSEEVDADACVALVIGKAGKRIDPVEAWDHIAGVTLLIDITARDINRREGLTTNNLLGKNFPSSTCSGARPAAASLAKRVGSVGSRAGRWTAASSKNSLCAIASLPSSRSSPAGRFLGSSRAIFSPSAPAWPSRATDCKTLCPSRSVRPCAARRRLSASCRIE